MTKYNALSVFDLDHTICINNASFAFGTYLVNQSIIPLKKIPFLFFSYFLHTLGAMEQKTLHKIACKNVFTGFSLETALFYVENFLNKYFPAHLNLKAYQKFQEAKKLGHFTVLLSNSPDFIVESVAKKLGFNDWKGSTYSLDSSQRIENLEFLMDGSAKARYAVQLMKKLNISKELSVAYTDDVSDIPLLEVVGSPVVVNPSNRLKRQSKKRGWPIL